MNLATQILLYGKPFRITDFFRMGQVGWHWQIDDPNLLYRRRNRLTYSRDFGNAAWAKTNILSVTTDADGVGDLVVPNTTNATHILVQAVGSIGVPSVLTIRAKAGGYNHIAVTAGTPTGYANVNTGTAGTVSGGMTVGVSPSSDATGYFDAVFTYTPTSVNTTIYIANADGSPNYAGDGTSGVYIARAQLETYTTTPTEYQDVPTTWAQAYLDAVGAERIYAWTDTAGTTPVTAIGEGIGLLMGREYGGVRGAERKQTGAVGLIGAATAATYNTSTGAGTATRVDASNQSYVEFTGLTTNSMYEFVIANTGAVTINVRTSSPAGAIPATVVAGATAPVKIGTGGGITSIYLTSSLAASIAFTVQSVREIPGTHLTQATGTAKPTLSARVNMLLNTEAFDAANWTATGTNTVTANNTTAPNGTATADLVTVTALNGSGEGGRSYSSLSVTSGVTYVVSWHVLPGTATSARIGLFDGVNFATRDFTFASKTFGNSRGSLTVSNVAYQELAGGWFRISASIVSGATGSAATLGVNLASTGTAWVWGADLRTADDAAKNIPAYQRVGATATDYDTDGFPHYALADGTDDCWASVATVDGSGTNKVTVVAAVTKLSDAADGTILSFGDPSAGDNGTFIMQAPGSAAVTKLQFSSRGTAQAVPFTTSTTYNAPVTMVAGAVADIGAPLSQLSVNGVTVSTITTTQGTGNYNSAKSISVGQRIGGTARFNGRFYGSTGRFGPMSDSERNNLTRWWQKRIGTA